MTFAAFSYTESATLPLLPASNHAIKAYFDPLQNYEFQYKAIIGPFSLWRAFIAGILLQDQRPSVV